MFYYASTINNAGMSVLPLAKELQLEVPSTATLYKINYGIDFRCCMFSCVGIQRSCVHAVCTNVQAVWWSWVAGHNNVLCRQRLRSKKRVVQLMQTARIHLS